MIFGTEGFSKKKEKKIDPVRRELVEAIGAGAFISITGKLGMGLSIFGKKDNENNNNKSLESISAENNNSILVKKEEINETVEKIKKLKNLLNKMEASENVKKNSLLFLIQSEMLKNDSKFFPPEIFSDSFFWSVIRKESSFGMDVYNERSGASGVMQLLPIAVKDTLRVLNKFKRKDRNHFLNGFDEELKNKEISDILEIVKKNWDLGEAIGRLYFLALFKNYHIGEKEFLSGDYKEARRKLLIGYNAGWKYAEMSDDELERNLNQNKYREVTTYYKKILEWVDEMDDNSWDLAMAIDNFKNNKG